MPEVIEQAKKAFLAEWKTFWLIVLAGVGTWGGIYLDMFDAGLWEQWVKIGVYGYVSRTVLKKGLGSWEKVKLNGKG